MGEFRKSINYLLLNIGFTGNEEEKEIVRIKKNLGKMVIGLSQSSPKKEWENFYVQKKDFEEKLSKYSGIYSEYFNSKLRELKLEEKWAWGYGITSN